MKLFTAALTLLLAVKGAAQECPSELTKSTSLNEGALTLYHEVVGNILCARLESDTESWISFGISPAGTMDGGESVIGLPGDGTVMKYTLSSDNDARIVPMADEKQTLLNTSITQEGGKTVMVFAKYLQEDGENEILANGDNTFLFAVGSSNDPGYHAARGAFSLDLEGTASTEVTTEASIGTTEAPPGTTEAPTGTTEAPPGTTEAPPGSTEAPIGTTEAPIGTTEAPIGTTEAPIGTTEAPIGTTEAPIGTTEAPTGTTEAPTGTTEAPIGTTEAPPVSAQECPSELTKSTSLIDGSLTLYTEVVGNILCARLESDTDGWISFGISPAGTMEGGEAIIGNASYNAVMKVTLSSDNDARVVPMADEKQTLMNTSITQEDGKTVMVFAKYLKEEGEHEILANGENTFLWAVGSSNEPGYHAARGDFKLDLEGTTSTEATSTEVIDGDDPAPSPPTPDAPTPDAPTPDAPTPTTAPTPPSGAMAREKIATMILGAGAVAVWFGM